MACSTIPFLKLVLLASRTILSNHVYPYPTLPLPIQLSVSPLLPLLRPSDLIRTAWMWGLPLQPGQLTRRSILRDTASSSPSNYQLLIAPRLGVGLHASLLPPCWDFVWLELSLVLCMQSHPCKAMCASALCIPPCFTAVVCHPVLLYFCHSAGIPEPWQEGVWYRCPI